MLKAIVVAGAAAVMSSAALAQGTAPQPPIGPTEMQCQDGYKDGMQWTRDQFTAACAKLRESKKN
jgi:hypothetical protein